MRKMKIVYFVRHGESIDNALPVFQSYDSPLSKRGHAQAQKLGERIKHLDFEALIASPQIRAQETAQAISKHTGKQIESSDLFIERFKPSSIDGKPWNDTLANKIWREWEKSFIELDKKAQDGENFQEIVDRATRALTYLETHTADSLVVVSHGHFIRTILATVMLSSNIQPDTLKNFYTRINLENTGISVLKFSDSFEEDFQWRIVSLNDHAHFAE